MAKDKKGPGPKSEKGKAPPAAKPAKAEAKAPVAAAPKVEAPKAVIPAAPAVPVIAEAKRGHGFKRKMIGRITSDKMNKTVTVEVIRNSLDPVYKKYVRKRDRYKAHDETNQYKTGDRVEIQEHRPLSRDKRWLVTKLIARRVEE
jgi:small subunit ribosomal protein S17